MNCPHCDHPQTCPCVHCQKTTPTEKPWIWTADGESAACGECGVIMHADEWLDVEAAYFKEKEKAL